MYRLKRARGCRWRAWLGGVEFNCRRSTTHNVGSRPINLTGGNFFSVSSLMNWDTFLLVGIKSLEKRKNETEPLLFYSTNLHGALMICPLVIVVFLFFFFTNIIFLRLYLDFAWMARESVVSRATRKHTESLHCPWSVQLDPSAFYFFSLTKAATGWELANTTTRRFLRTGR